MAFSGDSCLKHLAARESVSVSVVAKCLIRSLTEPLFYRYLPAKIGPCTGFLLVNAYVPTRA